jgi:hypothetical protein
MKLYDEISVRLWRMADPTVRFIVFVGSVLFLVAALSTVPGCGMDTTALRSEVEALVQSGDLSRDAANAVLDALDNRSDVPAWVTTAGAIGGALLTSFLGVRVAKNGMAKSLEAAQSLASQAHDRLSALENKA